MTVTEVSGTFGQELRRRRVAAGLSLGQLAHRLHYSKGYLSKIETGRKPGGVDMARMCDEALHADGELAALIGPPTAAVPDSTGVLRREFLEVGALSLIAAGMPARALPVSESPAVVLAGFRSVFDLLRGVGRVASPGLVLPVVSAQTRALTALAEGAAAKDKAALLRLAAHHAEYAGWMWQEAGSATESLSWTAAAVELATAGGDGDMAAYALVRRALVALYRRDAYATIELARLARADGATPRRIRGLAAQREAQGHALAGDRSACLRSLDQARDLLAQPRTAQAGPPVLGPTSVANPVELTAGWCLLELGRPAESATVLAGAVTDIAPDGHRCTARFGVRLALATATAGDVEGSCALTRGLLPGVMAVASSTIRADLRRLARTLSRWPANPAVRALTPALTDALPAS
jgi:transcriptional regulator with XRE-family HTH domain